MSKLSTLYATFDPKEVARLALRFRVHHTPKHGNWLSVAEIAVNALTNQCFKRRIPDREAMVQKVAAWKQDCNAGCKTTNWQFKIEDARLKLKSLYPPI